MSGKLLEINSDGETVRTIVLDAGISQPLHSVQLAGGEFVVCSCGRGQDRVHRVSVVNEKGAVERSYGSTSGAAAGQLSWPTHLAVDRDGFVLVADRNNARVLLLSPRLEFVCLVLPNELQRRTNHVYVDLDADKLYTSSGVFDERRSVVTAIQL